MPKTRPAPSTAASPLPARLLQDTASKFALLSATVRLHILWLLASEELDVSTLAAATGQSVATASHHLNKLKLAGLVHLRRHGKRHVYAAADPLVMEIVRLAIGAPLNRHRRAGDHNMPDVVGTLSARTNL